jgi:hypothetical protein
MPQDESIPWQATDTTFTVREIFGIPLGKILVGTGAFVLVFNIGSFLLNNGESDVFQVIAFIYGIPALVAGFALEAGSTAGVPFDSTPAAEAARDAQANDPLKKIVSDCTQATFGDAHLQESIIALGLGDFEDPPVLSSMSESLTDAGRYKLTLTFDSPLTPYKSWKERAGRMARFFGPNVRVETSIADKEKRQINTALIMVKEGDDMTPTEVLADGSIAVIDLE